MKTFFVGAAALVTAVSARQLAEPSETCPTMVNILENELPKILSKDYKGVAQDFEQCQDNLGQYLEVLVSPIPIVNKHVNITQFCAKKKFYTKACVLNVGLLADTVEKGIEIFEVAHNTGRRLAAAQCPSLMTLVVTMFESGIKGVLKLLDSCTDEIGVYLASILPKFLPVEELCQKIDLVEAVCEVHINTALDLAGDALDAFKEIHQATKDKLLGDLIKWLEAKYPTLFTDIFKLLEDVSPLIADLEKLLKDLDIGKLIQDILKIIQDLEGNKKHRALAAPACPEGAGKMMLEFLAGGLPNVLHGLEQCHETTEVYLEHVVAGVPKFVKSLLKMLFHIELDVDSLCAKNKFFQIACAEELDTVANFADDLAQLVSELIHGAQAANKSL